MAFVASLVINDALSIVGNPSPNSNENAQAVRTLNNILATISTEDFAVISSTQDSLTLVDGTESYTYGSGGTLNSTRPNSIRSAFLRDTNGDDFPIEIITENEYNLITDKDSKGFPNRLFYKPDFPLGILYLYPCPDAAYTLKLNTQKRMATVTNLADSITLPDEYIEYLIAKLVIRVGRFYGYSPTTEDYLIARESEGNVKTTNSEVIIRRPTSSVTALGRTGRRHSTVNWEE